MKKISVVVSVYNEEKGLRSFYTETTKVLKAFTEERAYEYELFFVNDGSSDLSCSIIKEFRAQDPEHVSYISFSRNFGHEAAMTAGLDYASGDYLIFMDADLQHPPACIPDITAKLEEGYSVVNMVRTQNKSAGLIKNITSDGFYMLINKLSAMKLEPAASDFFAMDRQAAEVLRHNFREKIRFLRGYVQNIGFKKTTLEYAAAERVAGESHYSLKKLWRFSIDTIMSFSDVPLKAGIYAGFASGFLGVLLIIYTLITRKGAPSGYATIVIVLCFMFAVLFFIIGIIGEYISMIFREIKDRPIYIVENVETADKFGEQAQC